MGRNRLHVLASAVGVLSLVVGAMTFAQPAVAIIDGQRDTVHTNVGVIRFTTERAGSAVPGR